MRIIKIGNARFIENGKINGSDKLRNVVNQEFRVQVTLPITSNEVVPTVVEQLDNDGQ